MPQRNYLISITALSTTASGTTVGSGNTQSASFVVARTLVRTGLGAGELLGDSQTWTIHYVVSAMATPYEMRLKLQRRNSSGVVQSESSFGTTRSAIGTYDDNITWVSGTWNANDQLALVWEHRKPSGSGNKNGTIDANGASYVDAPAIITTNLVIQNASHAHSATTPTLSVDPTLVIGNGLHSHTAGSLTLSVDQELNLGESLVGFWKLGESAGFTRNDSASTNHLAETGGTVAQLSPGKVGDAASFIQTNYLSVADNASLSITGNLSIACWFRLHADNTNGFPGIVSKWGAGDQRSYSLRYEKTANRFVFSASSDGTGATAFAVVANTFGAPSTGVWYFLQAYVDLDSDQINIRVGTAASIGTWETPVTYTAATVFDSNAPLEIGRMGTSSNVIYGDIDAAGLWSRKLTEANWSALWNSGAGLELISPVAKAGLDQTRMELETVFLDGSQSVGDGLSYSWAQISGTSVTLINPTTETPSFTAPDVAVDTALVFRLTVTETDLDTAQDDVTITIVPTGSNKWLWHTPQEANIDPDIFYSVLNAVPSPVLFARNGRIVGAKGDITLAGYTWSASKMLTALIAARQIFLGNVGLTTTIPNSDFPTTPTANLKQFLNMTSDYGLNLPSHSPGDHFAYNNGSVHHYGTYLKDTFYVGNDHVQTLQSAYVTALNFEDALIYELTTWAGANKMSGWNGGWKMSTRDLARIAQLVLQQGVWNGTRLLDEDFMVNGLWQEQIPETATQSTDEDDPFYNQAATSAVLKDDWSLGFWFLGPHGIQNVAVELLAMFGLYGTDVYISRQKSLIVATCNLGGQTTESPSPRITAAQVTTVVNASVTPVNNLVIQNSSHAHSAANLALTQVHELVVATAVHAQTATNLDLTETTSLIVENADHTHSAEQPSLTQVHVLAINDATHAHTADNLTLAQAHQLATNNAAHSQLADNLSLTQTHELITSNAAHTHSADNAALTQAHVLAVDSGVHAHTGQNVVLAAAGALEISNSNHGHTAANVVLTQTHELVVAGSAHSHSSDNLALVQTHELAIASANHAHSAANIVLSVEGELGIANSVHAHTAQNLTLTQVHELGIANGTHTHASDSTALTQAHQLAVAGAVHAHAVESLALTQTHVLSVSNGVHAHAVESPALTQLHVLAVQNAAHPHVTENLTLMGVSDLVIAGASHGLASTEIVLTQAHELGVSTSLHAHAADNAVFTQDHILAVQNTQHAHVAANVTLGQVSDLAISNGAHSLTSPATVLTQDHQLVIAGAAHAQTADSLTFTQVHGLAVQGSLHSHLATTVTLTQAHELIVQGATHVHTAEHPFVGIDLSPQPSAIITVLAKPNATLSVQLKPSATITKWPS